jgi:hypothetical protein
MRDLSTLSTNAIIMPVVWLDQPGNFFAFSRSTL